ncbi:tail fiber domain-containing protein [Enterobacter roggenkampii]|nr:tail fiber domain-containing protein [Enterobacter roggenkampii]
MTVSTVVDHNDYTGNGVTTSFPYTFRIFKKTDLAVSVVDLSENITVLVLDTDYTVTNAGGYSGGSVVLTTPLANGWQISIARELEPTQETDLRNQGKFFAEVHEDAFDKLTMLIQQAYSLFRLALRKPSSVANWYDAMNNYIRNLKDPRDPQDATTKKYTDDLYNQFSNLLGTIIDTIENGLYGYNAKRSFELGNTLNYPNDILYWESESEYYRWDGALPKVVPPGSTPSSTGGIGSGKWVSVGDASLRSDLASASPGKGVNLVYDAVKRSGDAFTGHVDMPSLTVKSTFGNVIVGDQPVGVPGAQWPLPDSLRDAINVSRLLSNTPFNCHAFSDKTVLSQGTAIDGYGAFDSTVIIYGSHRQDHAHSFQDRVSYRGSNRLDNTYGYYSAPTISGTGTVGDRRGIFINDVAISGGGNLEQQTGVYLEDLKAASGINVAYQTRQTTGYTFYAPNSARMYHKGAAGFGYDPVAGDTNFALHFRGSAPLTSYYGFLHTDNSGASLGVSQDASILFIQGGSVRAKIKPQATTLSAFTPGDDNHTPCGDILNRWSVVVAGTGSILTSDGTEKSEPLSISDNILDAWGDVNIIVFQWLASQQEKGVDKARWHFGAIAQQVRDAFLAHGIDGQRYGLLCFDSWDDQYVTHPAKTIEHPAIYSKILNHDGSPALLKEAWTEVVEDEYQELVTPAGSRWGLRPDQCFWLESAYQRRRADRFEARLEKIEKHLL